MKVRAMNVLMSVAMVVGILGPAAPALAGPPLPDYKPVDVGPELREWEADQSRIEGGATAISPEGIEALEAEAMAAVSSTPYTACVLDTKVWMSLNDYAGAYFFTTFYLVAETPESELWVQANLSWPAGDPRPTPVVTCEQAVYLLGEFDNNIYPVETDFFATPDLHDGANSILEDWGYFPEGYYANEAGRQVVLVSNIRDDSFYDYTYPNYIAGFYSPSFEAYFDRNIMSIDAYDWANRVGPDGSRPYLYESVFAHEYQHLLHDDYDGDEVSWINEGLSMFAEYLTGYVVNDDNYTTFQELPENSLVVWGDQGGEEIVADYGMVFLYHMFLYEKFGPSFLQAEFFNPDNGITSINSTMASNNKWKKSSFADTYHDFSVAVLIDSAMDKYRYGFKLLDVGIDVGTAAAPNPEAFDTPGAPPWGSDYLWITGKPRDLARLTFNGVNYSAFPTSWTSNGSELWGGTGDLLDNWAIFPATGGGTLTFDTKYNIEQYWDFGFVQVSTDGGYTWTSLANEFTTADYDPSAHPTVIANLPGLTGSSGWVNMSFDLAAFAGEDILVAFRYVTDWAFSEPGWFIDNVYVDDRLISDGTDASVFKDITEIIPVNNDFTVTFVAAKGSGKHAQYRIKSLRLNHETEDGQVELRSILKWCDSAVMIVTFDAPEGVDFYANYTYELTSRHSKPRSQPPIHGHQGHGTHFERPRH
jgi:immune inhibitor A